jgi:hypothetical protein
MDYESVKIKKETVEKVRKNKGLTGVSIAAFFELAATEKLEREKLTKKD